MAHSIQQQGKSFEEELKELINKHSEENESNTPDFILAEYIAWSLHSFNWAVNRRTEWYGYDK